MSCVRLGRCGDYGWFVVDLVGHSGVFHLVSYPSQSFTTKKKGPESKEAETRIESEEAGMNRMIKTEEKKANKQCNSEIR
jgi:hypothetical protein